MALVELRVLGLVGKLFSGLWMKKFYTSAATTMNHMEAINVVHRVLDRLREAVRNPQDVIQAVEDFFGNALAEDNTLRTLNRMHQMRILNCSPR